MFLDSLNNLFGFNIYGKIIIYDLHNTISEAMALILADRFNYQLIYYDDVEEFRYLYETEIKKNNARYLVLIKSKIYLPYDIRQVFQNHEIGYDILFPKLNSYALKNSFIFDMDLLNIAYNNLYRVLDTELETKRFLSKEMYSAENIKEYSKYLMNEIRTLLYNPTNHVIWRDISLLYSKLEYVKYKSNYTFYNDVLVNEIQDKFKDFIWTNYSSLSSFSSHNGPVLLNKALNYVFTNSKKPALIIMDGMSITDWLIISEELDGIKYKYNSTYAIIPTITSISRQCLLSGKLPIEMKHPFSLTYERAMFIENCKENGYKEEEIQYYRGYDFEITNKEKCICVIINDIDDLVHSQKQGNLGMYNDINLLSKSGKISKLIKKLDANGFDVFIGSDHGRKEAITIGTPRGTGIEIETKSKRTMILREFGDYEEIKEQFGMIKYPPYYLPKDFNYLVCEHDKSLGIGDKKIFSHGGISIEEVIVPFIKIEGVNI